MNEAELSYEHPYEIIEKMKVARAALKDLVEELEADMREAMEDGEFDKAVVISWTSGSVSALLTELETTPGVVPL